MEFLISSMFQTKSSSPKKKKKKRFIKYKTNRLCRLINEETFFTQKVKFLLQGSIDNHKQTKNSNTSRKMCLSQHGYKVLQSDTLHNEFTVVSFIKCFQVSDYCFVSGGHRI